MISISSKDTERDRIRGKKKKINTLGLRNSSVGGVLISDAASTGRGAGSHNPALRKPGQEDLKVKVVRSYTVNLRPAWNT